MVAFVKKPRRPRRLLLKSGIVLVVAMITFYVAAPSTLGWYIGHKLKSELATRMNARLDFSRVIYKFPYGVRVENAHLLMPGGSSGADSSVDVGRLELTLAKLPLGAGPLLIEKLEIESPIVRLGSNYPAPAVSGGGGATATAASPSPPAPTKKLSDLFQLQNVAISNGRFEYDFSTPGHPLPPLVWGHLNADMNTLATSGSTYNFTVAVQDEPLAVARISGSFDIDALQLNLAKVNLVMACEPAQSPSQIPPQGRAVIKKLQIGGQLTLDGSAQIPLQSPEQGSYNANISIKDGHCTPPGWVESIRPSECTITSSNQVGFCKFDLMMKDRQRSAVTASGSFDLKTLMLDVSKFSVATQFDPREISNQVPASVAEMMHKMQAGGLLTFDGIAKVPVTDPQRGLYVARIELKNGRCQPLGWAGPVTPATLSIVSSNVSGATPQSLPQALPANLPKEPLQSHLWLLGLSAASGNQVIRIDGGEIDFDSRNNAWVVQKFHGSADVGDGPGPLAGENSRIIIPFYAAGDGKLGDNKSNVRIALDGGSAVLTQNHIHINRISGMLTATPIGLSSSALVGACADGQVKAIVNLNWQKPTHGPDTSLMYDGEIDISKLDLHQLAMQYTTDPTIRQKAWGLLESHLKYNGSILADAPESGRDSVADRLAGKGDVDITNGYFTTIPVLRDIVAAMKMGNVATVGEAAATFDLSHQVINFTRVGASSPALGIQGSGTLGFDMKTNMIFVATPLADWSKDAKGTGLINEAGAALVGKVQDVVNGMQRAIYQFRISGDVSDPKVDPVVIPFLSDKMAPLFQKMAGNQQQGSVAEELKNQQGASGGK